MSLLIYFFGLICCSFTGKDDDGSKKSIANLVSTKSPYIVIKFESTKEIEEVWINCFTASAGNQLIKLNGKSRLVDTIFTHQEVYASISLLNCEHSYGLNYTFLPGDEISLKINKNQYPIIEISNRHYNYLEFNYNAILNEFGQGIDSYFLKITNYILCNPKHEQKVIHGTVLNPFHSYGYSKSFLDSCFSNNDVSYDFYLRTSQYQYYSFLSGTLQSKNKSLINQHLSNNSINDSLVDHSYYIDFLYNYAIYKSEDRFTRKNHSKYYRQAEKMFSGKSREAVLMYSLGLISISDHSSFEILANEYVNLCKDPLRIDAIKRMLNSEKKATYVGSDDLSNINGKGFKYFSEILSANKEIVYVDFWASWCMPCIEELSSSKSLKKIYGDRVQFIYISIDQDIESWKKSSKRHGLDNDESFVLLGSPKSSIIKKLQIHSIPRYIILDKQGGILNNDAPRPTEPGLTKIFNKLLER